MDMCSQISHKILILFAVLLIFGSCGAMDTFLPSSGPYNVSARVNNLPLDEFSFISSNAKIQPFFEDYVNGDPDVTALMIYLLDSKGEIAGWKVIYSLDNDQSDSQNESANNTDDDDSESNDEENENDEDESDNSSTPAVSTATAKTATVNEERDSPYKNGEELIIPVKRLDYNLPQFPIPSDLPIGRYKMVSQVMKGNQTLYRSEKAFFYLADVNFSFDSIQIHQGGVSEGSQLIQKETVIMLEAKLDYDSRLDPYIVWYNGKRIISEGSFSNGAGNLLWKAPSETGFISLRAEVFPIKDRQGLSGYSKDISLLVSTKRADIHLLSENNQDILQWYVFEGDLRDSISSGSSERALKPVGNISPQWLPSGGTYGIASGINNAFTFPGISLPNGGGFWRVLFRFLPLNDGVIFTAQFGSPAVSMNLAKQNQSLVLTLSSPTETVSQTVSLPETDSFLTAEVYLSVQSNRLTVMLDLLDDSINHDEIAPESITLKDQLNGEFLITLGSRIGNDIPGNRSMPTVFTAIWDEFAFFKGGGEIFEELVNKDESSEEILLGEKERQELDASGSLT